MKVQIEVAISDDRLTARTSDGTVWLDEPALVAIVPHRRSPTGTGIAAIGAATVLATRIAAMAKATGLPVNRTTVHGHSDLSSVSRASCPCPNNEPRGVPGRCHRPGERDPAAADRDAPA